MSSAAKLKKQLDEATKHLLVARVAMKDGHHLVGQDALAKLARLCNSAHEMAGKLHQKILTPLLPTKSDKDSR